MCCTCIDEVREKTKIIERTKAKLLSAEDDIKDLNAEFELDRQDYLSSIRMQDKTIKLYEQLLSTVVPCLRRDCNYFNIDKVRVECEWDEEANKWILPKLTTNKTMLSPASLPKGGTFFDRKGGKGGTPVHGSNRNNSSTELGVKESSSSLLKGHSSASQYDSLDDDKYVSHLQQKSDESVEYFKPKRALELMGQSPRSLTNPGFSPVHNHANDSTGPIKGSGSLSTLPNAAVVHRVDPLLDTSYGRRPGRLQSLPRNPPVPQSFNSLQEPDILEKMEKKLSSRKKNLEPIADIRTTKKLSH